MSAQGESRRRGGIDINLTSPAVIMTVANRPYLMQHRRRVLHMRALIFTMVLLLSTCPAGFAQTPPSQSERPAYGGLHAAAARGSLQDIRALLVSKPDLN